MTARSPVLGSSSGLLVTVDRMTSINLRGLRAMRLLLILSFAAYVRKPTVRRLLLHCNNKQGVRIMNAMVSAFQAMMSEPRKL